MIDRGLKLFLRFYHGSNSSKFWLVILIGVRNPVLLFDCHERTLGHFVLPVLLLGRSCDVILLFSICRGFLRFLFVWYQVK